MNVLMSERDGVRDGRGFLTLSLTVFAVGFFFLFANNALVAQDSAASESRIKQSIECGEFSTAIDLAQTFSDQERDQWLQKIATAQSHTGALEGAFETAGLMESDLNRAQSLTQLSAYQLGYGESNQSGSDTNGLGGELGGTSPPQSGGITASDFQPLIDLVQGTIQTDSWQDTGQGEGTIRAFPSGVYVNGKGLLKRVPTDRSGKMKFHSKDLSQRSKRTAGNVMSDSKLRKVSLTELEKQSQMLTARGKSLTESMKNIAGLTEIQYVMMYPDTGEVIIAGPAGAWENGQEDRVVNSNNGNPVLQLDDLVVCLRNAWNEDGKFGCAIVPRKESLAETKKFLASSKLTGKAWRTALRQTLAEQDIDVFGIDAGTHAASVLVEADYRMKLVGMGLEPSIDEVPSYLDRVKLDANGNPPPMDVVRWWFTLSYDNVLANEARDLFSFSGPGVKVLSETEMINDAGQRIHTGRAVGPTKAFAEDFTEHFDSIADQYSIYKELKNVFDLAIVANLIRDQNLAQRAKWNLTFFTAPPVAQFVSSNGGGEVSYPMEITSSPETVETVMNHRILKERRNGVTKKHTLVGVSGGVSFNAYDAMQKGKIVTEDDVEFLKIKTDAANTEANRDHSVWWWD